MKLFFISDLHGSLPDTEKALEKFEASGAEHLVILGDILNHGPRNPVPDGYQPPAVADLLNHYSEKIIAIRGNCDSEVDQMLLNFPMLQANSWILLENGRRLFLTHGHTYNADNRPPLAVGDVMVHGHTHIPCAERNGDHIIYNPGSITFPKNGHPASFGILENQTLKVMAFNDELLAQIELS